MPLFSTKMMPVRVALSSKRGLPPSGLGGSSGKSGSTISQSSSVTNSLAMFSTYPDSAVLKESLRALVSEHGQESSLGEFLFEELYTFVGEGWEQEDDITLLTLRRSSSLS